MANINEKFNKMINTVNEYFINCKEMPYNVRHIVERIKSAYETRSSYDDLYLSYEGEANSIILDEEFVLSGTSEKTFNIFNLISRGIDSLHKDTDDEITYYTSVIEEFLSEKALREKHDNVYQKVNSFYRFLIGEADYDDVVEAYRS